MNKTLSKIVLPFETEPQAAEAQQQVKEQKVEYVRKRPNHKGRAKLLEHLPEQGGREI